MIVAMGDSITFGQHLIDGQAWPALLTTEEPVFPAGVPGDTTRLGLERFPRDVQALCPKTVVIQFGHNDCNRWQTDRGLPRVSPAAFKANLVEMVDRARTFGIRPFLCSLTPSFRSAEHAQDVANYDRIIRRVADEENVPLIDVRSAFDGTANLLMPDGLHLSTAGHLIYADTVQSALNRAA